MRRCCSRRCRAWPRCRARSAIRRCATAEPSAARSPTTIRMPIIRRHEVDAAYMGLPATPGSQERANIMRWREAERARLIAARLAIPADERVCHAKIISGRLDALLPTLSGRAVSLYWPLRGQTDLRE